MSDEKKRLRTVNGEHARRALLMLGGGFSDYVAARVLIFRGLVMQASVLAATAVEKHLKSHIALRKMAIPQHLGRPLLNAAKQTAPNLMASINQEFLQLLSKCYSLRYFDSLPSGFNLVIASNEFVAELDLTIHLLREGLSFGLIGEPPTSATDERLMHSVDYRMNNIIVSGEKKEAFISARPQYVYEMRLLKDFPILEVIYIAEAGNTDGNFLREALVPGENPQTFRLAFKQWDGKS